MNVKTVSYVNASEVFQNADELWEVFTMIGNWPFTWGDNEYSLVHAERVLDVLEEEIDEEDDDPTLLAQFEEVSDILLDLTEKGIYVNLER